MMRFLLIVVLLGSALLGCNHGPAPATVRGAVKLGGKPIEKGIISFSSLDNTGTPATVEIKQGQYEVHTTAGKKQVQISAPVVTEQRKAYNGPDAPLVDVTAESVPERYNAQTELNLDVAAGSNTKDWELDTK